MSENKKPLVIITHTLPPDWISSLTDHCIFIEGPTNATEMHQSLIDLLPKAEGLLSLLTIPVTENILNMAPKLKVVSNMAVGVDNVDIAACTQRGIPVGNTPGVLTESTADLTMALILSVARNIPVASRDAYEGRWKTWAPAGWLGMELKGSILGIIGMGKIGQAVAKRALGFGMKIIFADAEERKMPNTSRVSLKSLLESSDIVTLHTPLTSETRGIINKQAILLMKPTALLINAARGPLVDTNALLDALQNNIIAGAALDVTDPEPLPPSHPLFTCKNCLIVPHIGSATQHTRRKMAELACANLIAGLHQKPLPFCVNPEVYKLKNRSQ